MHLGTLQVLRDGPLCWFRDWPNAEVPRVAVGVYTIWDRQGVFPYVGMAGRAVTAKAPESRGTTGLFARLASHAQGRRGGDQFCVYVADRLVLPRLTAEQILAVGGGQLQLDALVRAFIAEHLGYRYAVVKDRQAADRLEGELRSGALGVRPLLNPRTAPPPTSWSRR